MTDINAALLVNFADKLLAGNAGLTGLDYARQQGWLDENGAVTKAGREAATALRDQQHTRSAFRIG
ncbi:MAG: hypothetical protein ACX939_08120 [Hyphococcus sp.]